MKELQKGHIVACLLLRSQSGTTIAPGRCGEHEKAALKLQWLTRCLWGLMTKLKWFDHAIDFWNWVFLNLFASFTAFLVLVVLCRNNESSWKPTLFLPLCVAAVDSNHSQQSTWHAIHVIHAIVMPNYLLLQVLSRFSQTDVSYSGSEQSISR